MGGNPLSFIDPLGLDKCLTVARGLFRDIQLCVATVPTWVPSPGVSHPEKDEVETARACPKDSNNCALIGLSIDILLRDLKFRRWDLQRYALQNSGRFAPGHIKRYNIIREELTLLVKAARDHGCPYNTEADREITLGPKFPTSGY